MLKIMILINNVLLVAKIIIFIVSFILLVLSSGLFFNFLESNKIIDKMSEHANTVVNTENLPTETNPAKMLNK